MAAVIELDNLSVSYYAGLVRRETRAVSQVSFQVEAGEVFGFLGPNGAGKTSTIHTLMGFIFPSGGAARLLGFPAAHWRARLRVGFLPENFAFHRYLTAEKLLRFHRRLAALPANGSEGVVQDLLQRVKLEAQREVRIGRFSRGMAQRIGLAQALLNDPDLLLLDEPTSGLDPLGRREVRELILALKAQGKTVFVSSHLLPEIEVISDRVAVIDQGRLKYAGRVQDLAAAGELIEVAISGINGDAPAAEELKAWIAAEGGRIVADGGAAKVTIDSRHKRALLERVWTSGGDVVSLNPVRGSLEDLFVKLVGGSPS
jgi:ABC-2 type transport system ATP-binding protein